MPRQTDNKLVNRKKSKECFDKHDPNVRRSNRREGIPASNDACSAVSGFTQSWTNKKDKERRSRNKTNHRHGQPSKEKKWA